MKIDVSVGELVDKASILFIKLEKIKNSNKRKNIKREFDLLRSAMKKLDISMESDEFKNLEQINSKLWDIEDKIRIKESKKTFDADFIQLARSVYIHNDHRAKLKREINFKFQSLLMEEKEYAAY